MVKIKEHQDKIRRISSLIPKCEGKQKKQMIKHLHRLQKELWQCQLYLRNEMK